MLQSTKTHFRNELLRRLGPADLSLLEPHFERISFKLKTVLQRPGAPIEFVYFPESCIASLIAKIPRGRDSEVGVIGFEGMTGTPLVMGDDRQPCECIIQLEGDATRLPAEVLSAAMAESPTLRMFLLRYVQSLSTQTSFTALANARSKLEERLARWLLMCADRVEGEKLELTHEFLSIMLGVRRPGVTVAIQILEGKGLIRANRGVVVIRDREGLIALTDGAYGIPEDEFERLVGKIDSAA
ncbi:Crp/Fnr family transcriptional regulator [Mesorhizobium sp. WSM2239]|uniref:Crp/Fnr family transcriptional regulator n=2 Tax=unclassified Mesorhizobium TaxID=325217 RepID=A0AAU8DDM7_9HYPH